MYYLQGVLWGQSNISVPVFDVLCSGMWYSYCVNKIIYEYVKSALSSSRYANCDSKIYNHFHHCKKYFQFSYIFFFGITMLFVRHQNPFYHLHPGFFFDNVAILLLYWQIPWVHFFLDCSDACDECGQAIACWSMLGWVFIVSVCLLLIVGIHLFRRVLVFWSRMSDAKDPDSVIQVMNDYI